MEYERLKQEYENYKKAWDNAVATDYALRAAITKIENLISVQDGAYLVNDADIGENYLNDLLTNIKYVDHLIKDDIASTMVPFLTDLKQQMLEAQAAGI